MMAMNRWFAEARVRQRNELRVKTNAGTLPLPWKQNVEEDRRRSARRGMGGGANRRQKTSR